MTKPTKPTKPQTENAMTLQTHRIGFAHTLDTRDQGDLSLARARDYIGQNVCVHSAPSAWYGIVISASIHAGVISVDIADAGLWTQGMTKDLILPARAVKEDLQARRDGVITVTAVTAIQPAGYFTEGLDTIKDSIRPRDTRPVPPELEGTSLEDFAKFQGATPGDAAKAVLEVYHKMGSDKRKTSKDSDGLRGNFAAVLELTKDYAATKNFPWRGTAAIVLAGARKYMW